jgi:DNA-directed RNA polymerase specialized sigma24 family protein
MRPLRIHDAPRQRVSAGHLNGVVLSEELANPSAPMKRLKSWLDKHPNWRDLEPVASSSTQVKQLQRRLDPAEEQRVIDDYLSGRTVYEVGELFKIHRTTVSAIMKRHGVKLRRQPKRQYRSFPDSYG